MHWFGRGRLLAIATDFSGAPSLLVPWQCQLLGVWQEESAPMWLTPAKKLSTKR